MQAAKRKSWLGELWRPLAALLLWAVGIVAAYAAPPLLPSLAETRIGGLTAFPVDCIPAVPLFSSDLTRACGPPLYDSASGCSVEANRAAPTLRPLSEAPAGQLVPETVTNGAFAPYNRRLHYGSTPTAADRAALGGASPDHTPPLVQRYYNGDPATGELPGIFQTPAQRAASAADRSRMLPATQGAQNAQGGSMSHWSVEQRRIWFENH